MKVLFVFNEVFNENLYVYSLRDALLTEGIEVKCSTDEFWHSDKIYDITHFNWIIGHMQFSDSNDLNRFITQFNIIKNKSKIVVTCHDLKPHYSKNDHLNYALKYIYDHCDAMIHLGHYSYDYFVNTLNNKAKNYIIPHHIYDNSYNFQFDKSIVRKQKKIPLDANVLLCFGRFRDDIERNLVLMAWKSIKIKNKYLLAPGFYRLNMQRRNKILLLMQIIKAIYYKLRGVHFTNQFIPHNMLETYLCASDILMIQRAEILNSGNLSLGFHAQKVVVGPNVGNIKEILEKTGNPVFDPNDISSVTQAIQEGFRLIDTDLPKKNYDYAMKNWNVSVVTRKHIEVYKDVLSGK